MQVFPQSSWPAVVIETACGARHKKHSSTSTQNMGLEPSNIVELGNLTYSSLISLEVTLSGFSRQTMTPMLLLTT